MNLKALDVWLEPYWLDEEEDVLHIEIDDDPTCFQVGYIEVPPGEIYEINTFENEDGKIGAIDIIYPENFLSSEKSDQIYVLGVNLKDFVLKTLEEHEMNLIYATRGEI